MEIFIIKHETVLFKLQDENNIVLHGIRQGCKRSGFCFHLIFFYKFDSYVKWQKEAVFNILEVYSNSMGILFILEEILQ